uniref:Uncharacterized protein n=1 Tax=Anguilla anguilla TaxID=7936 RepID=A0A0E9UZR1_ANGAN
MISHRKAFHCLTLMERLEGEQHSQLQATICCCSCHRYRPSLSFVKLLTNWQCE